MTMNKMFEGVYTGMLLIMIAGTFMNPQGFFLLSIGYYAVLLQDAALPNSYLLSEH